MSKRKPAASLHALLFGDSGPDSAYRVLVAVNGTLHRYTPEHGLRPCATDWARRALVVSGVDPSLVLVRDGAAEAGAGEPERPGRLPRTEGISR